MKVTVVLDLESEEPIEDVSEYLQTVLNIQSDTTPYREANVRSVYNWHADLRPVDPDFRLTV